MNFVKESIFLNALRSFFVALFGSIGAFFGFFFVIMLCIFLISSSEDKKKLPSKLTILPDAEGNRKELSVSSPVILQISIEGVIGSDPITAEKIEEILLDSREEAFHNDRVKGILLVIDSPGGGVNDSDIIYRLIKAYKSVYKIPVYAYVNGMCASGGYYIACAADKIYASPVSIIGSIGVISWPPYFNAVEAMKKIGVSALTLSAGQGKDSLNPTRPWTADEGVHRQALLDFFYKDFVSLVTQNRPKITEEDLVKIYGAEVFPAPDALLKGYIDAVVDLKRDALTALVQTADIHEPYQVVCFKTKSWWKELFQERALPVIKHEFSLPSEMSLEPCRFQYRP
ncbi:MAG: S49 family peptidase [Verrucomicrobia bacterium]|nr:S49 family peptidase [Verrucomicrobiota bacterium]MBS0645680.1 S49 family peptidase [Verrucomicrobiota bacterium]